MNINPNPLEALIGSQEPTISVLTITPEMASAILKHNTNNRSISRMRVRMYADAMKRGQWKINGESIKTSRNPVTGEVKLLDGQHRLIACVESGMPFTTLAVSDLEESVFSVIDRGRPRNNNDVLAIAGVKGGGHIAPVVKYLILIEAGMNPRNKDSFMLVSGDDVLEYTRKHYDDIQWGYALGRRLDGAIGGIRTAWVTAAILIANAREEREAVERFLEPIITGEALLHGDPRLALRNWVIRNGTTRSGAITTDNIATYIRVFNQWMAGEELKIIRPWTSASDWPQVSLVALPFYGI